MKTFIFKLVMTCAMFIFLQGVVVPWAISNNILPLWADILILSAIVMIWVAMVERMVTWTCKQFGVKNDLF